MDIDSLIMIFDRLIKHTYNKLIKNQKLQLFLLSIKNINKNVEIEKSNMKIKPIQFQKL